ncbi:trypsin-like serine protease [Myxococcota bacterium]|nr:trypsin-like serine protease [Myxococcota bacterium]
MKSFCRFLVPLFLFVACQQPQQSENPADLVDSTYILYGSADHSAAHQAVVYISKDEGGGYMSACTGTLISSDVVLTAGHCIGNPSDMTVYFGDSTSSFYDMRQVSDTEAHPQYVGSDTDLRNDIAVIRLSSSAPSSITPIPPLPASVGMSTTDENTTNLQYVGFGQTETGSSGTKLTITRPPVKVCLGSNYCQFNLSGVGYVELQPKTMGIAMDSSLGGICSGDSGGPAFVTRGNTEYVAGVSSWVLQDNYGNCAYMGASTIVSEFSTFINDYLGTSAEICTNGTDDDGDGLVDCNDNDCVNNLACQEHACDVPYDVYCGDEITATTVGADSYYTDYSACSPGAPENGGEKAFRVNAPQGTQIIATLSPSSSTSNIDLFLSKNGCTPDHCVDYSIYPTGQVEQLFFNIDTTSTYLMVETYQNAGAFTLSINCDSDTPVENCTNGIDDDDDGRVDCADPDCYNHGACVSTDEENCTNGVDDDGDHLVDCLDADCMHTATCMNAVENCTNGIDDDGDLKADCDDRDCASLAACQITGEICNNGVDDDGDGKADCNDPDCITASNCRPLSEICNNGIDDDGDLLIDCLDADCHSFAGCPVPQGEICYNYEDDDGDGLADCADPDCISSVRCAMANIYAGDTGTGGKEPDCNCTSAGATSTTPLPLFMLLFLGFIAFFTRRTV